MIILHYNEYKKYKEETDPYCGNFYSKIAEDCIKTKSGYVYFEYTCSIISSNKDNYLLFLRTEESWSGFLKRTDVPKILFIQKYPLRIDYSMKARLRRGLNRLTTRIYAQIERIFDVNIKMQF